MKEVLLPAVSVGHFQLDYRLKFVKYGDSILVGSFDRGNCCEVGKEESRILTGTEDIVTVVGI